MGRRRGSAAPTRPDTDGVIQQSRKPGRRGPDPLLICGPESTQGRVSCPGGASSRAGAQMAPPTGTGGDSARGPEDTGRQMEQRKRGL